MLPRGYQWVPPPKKKNQPIRSGLAYINKYKYMSERRAYYEDKIVILEKSNFGKVQFLEFLKFN